LQISFNGVIKPYTYNCPYAHKLRNIDKIFPSDVLPPKEDDSEEESAASFGIDHHDLVAEYITQKTDEYEHSTETIKQLRHTPNVRVETTRFLSLDLEPLSTKPSSGDYISYRTDASLITLEQGNVFDWKFGNPDYGHTIYFDEVDFFVFGESLHHPEVGEWRGHIHFPIPDYTLPVRSYSSQRIARVQSQWLWRIEKIINDKFCKPKPSTIHCRFCDYRPIENGGCGVCEHAMD
jgi:hypothetical protein